jgi:hypothetical protein
MRNVGLGTVTEAVLQRASPLVAQRLRAAALFLWAQQRALFRRVLADA